MITMLTDYERYQLEWMIEHGYSLKDFLESFDSAFDSLGDGFDPGAMDAIDHRPDAFEVWIRDHGFNGEVFASEEEYREEALHACGAAGGEPASYKQAIAEALRKKGWSVIADTPEPILSISRESPATGRTFLMTYDDLYDCWCNGAPLPEHPEPEAAFEECGSSTHHGFGFHAQKGTRTDYVIGWPFENDGWAVLAGSYDLEDEGLDCHIPEGYLNGLLTPYGYSSLDDLRSVNGYASRNVLTGIIARDQEENRFEVPHIFQDAASAARFCAALGVPEDLLLPAMERVRAEYERRKPSLDTPQAVREALASGESLYNPQTGEFWWEYNSTGSIANTRVRLDDPNLLAVIDDPDFDLFEDVVGGLNYTSYITDSIETIIEDGEGDVPPIDPRDEAFARIASEDGWVVATPENVRGAVRLHMADKGNPIGRVETGSHGIPTTADLKTMLSDMAGAGDGQDPASRRRKV